MIITKNITKEVILKFLLVIGAILLCLLVIIVIISCFFEEYVQIFETLITVDLIIFAIIGMAFMVLAPIFKIKLKSQAAEKFDLTFDNYDDFLDYFKIRIREYNYEIQQKAYTLDRFEMLLFTRKKSWLLECISVIKVPELTNESLELADEKFNEFLVNFYGTEIITDWVSLISLICVDRITPPFQKYVNSNIKQNFKSYKLPVGISFGGGIIYIAKQKDGFALTKYKNLKKQLLRILSKAAIHPTTDNGDGSH